MGDDCFGLDAGGRDTAYEINLVLSYCTVSANVWVGDVGCYREFHEGSEMNL